MTQIKMYKNKKNNKINKKYKWKKNLNKNKMYKTYKKIDNRKNSIHNIGNLTEGLLLKIVNLIL